MRIQGNENPQAKPIKEYFFGLVKRFETEQEAADYSKTTGKMFIYIT